jgi:polyhydroxybutyrate depolymerase
MNVRKMVVVAALIFIGLPVVLILIGAVFVYALNRTNGTIVSSGQKREYLLYVPRSYDRAKPTPLVISMHAAAMWPAAQMSISEWNKVADEHSFIVVYPSGAAGVLGGDPLFPRGPKVWEGGGGDVTFISDLIDNLEAAYNIDATRIYVNGFSNGGEMSFEVSCGLPDRIAAVGVVAAAVLQIWNSCKDSAPVPMMAFHGTADRLAPYYGGTSLASPPGPVPFMAVRDWVAAWAQRNECEGVPIDAPITASVRQLAYTNCSDNADVILYTVDGGGHSWPSGKRLPEWMVGRTNSELNASSILWEFFREHPLRRN